MPSTYQTKPASITFEPLELHAKFQKQLAIQIAFYRNDKIKKIQPIKVQAPQNKVKFKDPLRLYTTINHCSERDLCESKTFSVQIVYKLDSEKGNFEKELDVKDLYGDSKEIRVMSVGKKHHKVELKYRFAVLFKDDVKNDMKKQLLERKDNAESNEVENLPSFGNKKKKEENNIRRTVVVEQKTEDNNDQRKQLFQAHREHTKSKTSFQSLNSGRSTKALRFAEEGSQIKQSSDQTQKNSTIPSPPRNPAFSANKRVRISKTELRQKDTTSVSVSQREKKSDQEQETNNKENKNVMLNEKVSELETKLNKYREELKKRTQKYNQLEINYQKLVDNYKIIEEKYDNLKKKSTEKGASEQESKIREKYESLKELLQQSKKSEQVHIKKCALLQEQMKEFHSKASNLKEAKEKIKNLQKRVSDLESENSEFQQLLLQTEQKGKSKDSSDLQKSANLKRIEESLSTYKERIKILERQLDSVQQQKNYHQKETMKMQEQYKELKLKVNEIREESLEQLNIIADKDYEIEKLEKKLKEISVRGKKNSKKSHCSDDDGSDSDNGSIKDVQDTTQLKKSKKQIEQLKSKLLITTRNLENKQKLLNGFDEFNREEKARKDAEIAELLAENKRLRQNSNKSHSNMNEDKQLKMIEQEMEIRKLKTELEYKTKLERKLLIEKSQLQTNSKSMQDEIIKSKEAIANMINVIHQFGNEGLIEEINEYLCSG